MNQNPLPLTPSEWSEVVAVDTIRELWGLESDETGETFSQKAYGAKFDFVSAVGPGSGDVYVIMDDAFDGPPVVLTRNEGKLGAVRFDD
jgi:hypothetical protein